MYAAKGIKKQTSVPRNEYFSYVRKAFMAAVHLVE